MNTVLREILETGLVRLENGETLPLRGGISPEEGSFLQKLIALHRPSVTIEVGLAFGVSALYICEALREENPDFRHYIVDPNQRTNWHNVGLKNLREAGFLNNIIFFEEKAEIALPKILEQGKLFDFAFIDGWHTFDHTLADFFFINKMLKPGGVVAFDDAQWHGVGRVIDHVLSYPCFVPEDAMASSSYLKSIIVKLGRSLTPRVLRCHVPPILRYPRCVALRKIGPDERPYSWYQAF